MTQLNPLNTHTGYKKKNLSVMWRQKIRPDLKFKKKVPSDRVKVCLGERCFKE